MAVQLNNLGLLYQRLRENIPPNNVLPQQGDFRQFRLSLIFPRKMSSQYAPVHKRYLNLARSTNLAFLSRTPISIIDHGENREAHWSPDGSRIVIKLVPEKPLSSVSLQFEGVIRVEGTLVSKDIVRNFVSVSPRKQSIVFSTQNPPAIQRIPWPATAEEVVGERGSDKDYGTRRRKLDNYDQWIINDDDFGWLVEPEVTISQILHDRNTGVESWITSDGRAYIVYLVRNDGLCQKNYPKQRRVEPEEHGSVYFEPRRALRIAINVKFSLIVVGMLGGGIQYTTFPADEGAAPTSQQIEIHNPFNRQTGPVCSMEWSLDGYVLAVGWQHGWGLFSVGGRCLVSGFGVEDVDEQKFQDTFMNGVLNLATGNFELIVLAPPSMKFNQSLTLRIAIDVQLFVIPFAKSATTGQHSVPLMILVLTTRDQPDISSDWRALKVTPGANLHATLHCVQVGGSPDAGKVSRKTFALFMQPNVDQQLSPDITFGQFSKCVLEEHYST
ncbi:hypothetical protein F5876DRAFT_65684 [Lentinula aff. lateritia]|uniref:Uncharacterized protein n=1 Tax=Lentinula aff. lateritia TaxID=2804960 RepID=A0ACC1U0I5_9AGAR|nr:hypothetical protein F5876DRAFT_65684 [Lentinula aff. lateritia]